VGVPVTVATDQPAGSVGAVTPSQFWDQTDVGGGGGVGMVSVRTSSICQ